MKNKKPQLASITGKISPELKDKVLFILQIQKGITIQAFLQSKCEELVKQNERK